MEQASASTPASGRVPSTRCTRRSHLAAASAAAWLAAACGAGAATTESQGRPAGCASRIEYFCRLRPDQGVNPEILPAFAGAAPNCTLDVTTIPSTVLQA
jgi:ABC-type glycerol-3-phosphate transport system substrate-binding protein